MDLKIETGIVAGKIWEYLKQNGESDVVKIKLDLNLKNSMLFLALGWLSREDKIIITPNGYNFKVKLK